MIKWLCFFLFPCLCYGSILSPEDEPTEATFAAYFRWVNHLQELSQDPPLIVAAFGKPTAPIDSNALIAFRQFWNTFPETSSLPYSETQGNLAFRQQMAAALEKEYNHQITADASHVIFTVEVVVPCRQPFLLSMHYIPIRSSSPFLHFILNI